MAGFGRRNASRGKIEHLWGCGMQVKSGWFGHCTCPTAWTVWAFFVQVDEYCARLHCGLAGRGAPTVCSWQLGWTVR